ncbi:MAG: hypothetical protein WA705_19280 [Candidatus Ozemobacteraceae bacterium]
MRIDKEIGRLFGHWFVVFAILRCLLSALPLFSAEAPLTGLLQDIRNSSDSEPVFRGNETFRSRWEESLQARKDLTPLMQEARELWKVILSDQGPEPAIADLVNAFYEAQGALECPTIFAYLIAQAFQTGISIEDMEALFTFNERLALRDHFARHGGPAAPPFSLDPDELEWAGFYSCLSRGQAVKETLAAIQSRLELTPCNPECLFRAARGFALTSNLDRAKKYLVRASIMNKKIASRIPGTSEFAALASQEAFLGDLKDGKLSPEFEAVPDLGVASVDLEYSWSGLGTGVSESRHLTWNPAQEAFVEQSSGKTVPPWIIGQVLRNLAPASPTSSLAQRITHTDDYPEMYLKISGSETRHLFTDSNAPWMLPVNVLSNGKLSAVTAPALGQALAFLRHWVDIKTGQPRGSTFYNNREVSLTGNVRRGKRMADFEAAVQAASISVDPTPAGSPALTENLSLPMGWTLRGPVDEKFLPGTPFSIFYYPLWCFGKEAVPTKECIMKFVCGPRGQNWVAFTPKQIFSAFSHLEKILPSISSFYPGPDEPEKDPAIRKKEMQEFEIWISALGNEIHDSWSNTRNISAPLIRFCGTTPNLLPWGKPFPWFPARNFKMAGFSARDLGPEIFPVQVRVAFGQKMGVLGGRYLFGAQTLLINECYFPLQNTGPFMKRLLEFCGLSKATLPASLEYITLKRDDQYGRDSTLTLGFSSPTPPRELAGVASLTEKNGWTVSKEATGYVGHANLSFTFRPKLFFILDRDGKIRISQ